MQAFAAHIKLSSSCFWGVEWRGALAAEGLLRAAMPCPPQPLGGDTHATRWGTRQAARQPAALISAPHVVRRFASLHPRVVATTHQLTSARTRRRTSRERCAAPPRALAAARPRRGGALLPRGSAPKESTSKRSEGADRSAPKLPPKHCLRSSLRSAASEALPRGRAVHPQRALCPSRSHRATLPLQCVSHCGLPHRPPPPPSLKK
eukprot:352616-Chlamydomonas_euryale.AAC.5